MSDICFTPTTFVSLFALIFIVFTIVSIQKNSVITVTKPEYIKISSPPVQIPVPVPVSIDSNRFDDRTKGPERDYVSMSDTTNFHELGYVQDTVDPKLRMRLFGKRRFPRVDRFEYYVLDKNGIKIQTKTPREKELFENDTVTIPGHNVPLSVHIYDVSGPRYQAY